MKNYIINVPILITLLFYIIECTFMFVTINARRDQSTNMKKAGIKHLM